MTNEKLTGLDELGGSRQRTTTGARTEKNRRSRQTLAQAQKARPSAFAALTPWLVRDGRKVHQAGAVPTPFCTDALSQCGQPPRPQSRGHSGSDREVQMDDKGGNRIEVGQKGLRDFVTTYLSRFGGLYFSHHRSGGLLSYTKVIFRINTHLVLFITTRIKHDNCGNGLLVRLKQCRWKVHSAFYPEKPQKPQTKDTMYQLYYQY